MIIRFICLFSLTSFSVPITYRRDCHPEPSVNGKIYFRKIQRQINIYLIIKRSLIRNAWKERTATISYSVRIASILHVNKNIILVGIKRIWKTDERLKIQRNYELDPLLKGFIVSHYRRSNAKILLCKAKRNSE